MPDSQFCPKCGKILPANAPSGVCPKCLMLVGLGGDDSARGGDVYAATTPQPPGGFQPPAPPALAAHFPHLQILEVLGYGGMGAVYKARQSKLDRIVALKIIRPESADDPTFAERFNREARTLARLNHPHIVAVHDFGEVTLSEADASGKPRTLYYFLMEYVDGMNLRQLMEAGEVRPEQALAIIPQICEALQFAHDEGIVHRDIKPENVLIDSKGRVKIADFGLAKLAARSAEDFTLTATHQVMGTPRYMAPEQMTGSHHVDHRADIYSLGVVFYEMLTGEVPMGQFEPPSKRAPVDARLDGIVLRALAREPERRFQRASELKSSVEVISSAALAQPTVVPRDLPPRGASTIIEREVAAAWHWLAGRPATGTESQPQFPTLFAFALAVAGSLMVLLPWLDVSAPEPSTTDDGAAVALALESEAAPQMGTAQVSPVALSHVAANSARETSERLDAAGMMFVPMLAQEMAPESPAAPPFDGASTIGATSPGSIRVRPGETVTLHGSDVWPGIVASAVMGLLALLVLMVPPRLLVNWDWNLLIVVLAGIALLMTIVFRMEVDSAVVVVSHAPATDGESSEPAVSAPVSWPVASAALFQHAYWAEGAETPVQFGESAHRITMRPAYYGSLGLSLGLVLLGAMGVRGAIAHPGAPRENNAGTGTPLARVRFSVPSLPNLGQLVVAHFESHGYRSTRRTAEQWVFHRGSKYAGAYSFDIREYATTLTVRATPGLPGQTWVSCLWEVRKFGASITRNDIDVLESEGRELESMLLAMVPAMPTPAPAASATQFHDSSLPAADTPTHLSTPPIAAPFPTPQPTVYGSNAGDQLDLDEIRAEIDGPSLAMIVVGMLMMLAHAIVMGVMLSGRADEEIFLLVPGIVVGVVMMIGGIFMRSLTSRGWGQVGASFGLLPVSPGWLLSAPIGGWALTVLNRLTIRNAFLHRRRNLQFTSRTPGQVDLVEVESDLSGPALAMIVVGVLMIIGHAIFTVFCMSNPFDDEMAWIAVPGIIVGLGLFIGGLAMRKLTSRSWAQLGVVAGFIPAGPGWVLSAPIAGWALSILNRESVRQAFVQHRRERSQSRATAPPRFSRKAIVGAVWAGLFVLAAAAFVFPVTSHTTQVADENGQFVSSSPESVRTGPVALLVLIGAPVLLAPIGTTILGSMAISDIKHSQGRITGLGLAVTDALLFPLLVLNVAIFAAFFSFFSMVTQMEFAMAFFIALGATASIGFGVSAAIVQFVWKSARNDRDDQSPPGAAEAGRFTPSSQPVREAAPGAEFDAVEVKLDVSGPSLSMIVVGMLMFIVASFTAWILYSDPGDDADWLAVPSIFMGLAMLIGGLAMRTLSSRAWSYLGVIAGFIPLSPGCILSAPISIWAHRTLQREHVRRAFEENARQRTHGAAGTTLMSWNSTMALGLVWSLLVVLIGAATYQSHREAWGYRYRLEDATAGTLIPTGVTSNYMLETASSDPPVPASRDHAAITITAYGTGHSPILLSEHQVPRDRVVLSYAHGGAPYQLVVNLPELSYVQDYGTGESGVAVSEFRKETLLEWMAAHNLDTSHPVVDAEAEALFQMVRGAFRTRLGELVHPQLFEIENASGGVSFSISRNEEWAHLTWCLSAWGVGIVVILILTWQQNHLAQRRSLMRFERVVICTIFPLLFALGPWLYWEGIDNFRQALNRDPYGRPPLLLAVVNEDANEVRRLLDRGAEPNDGWRSLLCAAGLGNAEITRELLMAGAVVDAPGDFGISPLMFASALGHADVAQLLINAGANMNLQDDGLTSGAHSTIDTYFAGVGAPHGQNVTYWWPGRFQTPLMLAVREGHADVMQILLEAGASLDIADADGKTAADYVNDSDDLEVKHTFEEFIESRMAQASTTKVGG